MSSYEPRWKVLSDLLVELRSKGAEIPPEVVRDLRLSRSLIEAMKVSPHESVVARLDELLFNVEAYLLAETEEVLGPEGAREWSRRLEEAMTAQPTEAREAEVRFRPGLPRGEHWVRVRISEELPRDLLEQLATEEGVKANLQPDGYLLVSGEREKVRSFIRRLAEHAKPSSS